MSFSSDGRMVVSLAKNDFKSKYAGSLAGVFWAFADPVCTVLIYWFVNQVVFRAGDVGGVPYIIWLLCGIVPWFFLADSLAGMTSVFFDYSFLVKKVVFKTSSLPLVRTVSNFFLHLFFIAVLFLFCLIYGLHVKFIYFQLFYYVFASVFLAVGLGFVFSSFSVLLKDFKNIVSLVLQFGFWLTPIFWNVEMVPQISFLFKLNPVYYIVEGYRNTLIYNRWFFSDLSSFLTFWLISISIFVFGIFLSHKVNPYLADLV